MEENKTNGSESSEDKIDLNHCTASELASHLLQQRFEGNGLATASFLLECTSTLPNAEEISAQLMGGEGGDDDDEDNVQEAQEERKEGDTNMGDPLTCATEISMTTPRGKFQFGMFSNGIQFVNAKQGEVRVPPAAVEHIVVFPKPEDCRKAKPTGGDMVLLCFKTANDDVKPVEFKGKALSQICFQLPTKAPEKVNAASNDTSDDTDSTTNAFIELLCESLSFPASRVAWIQNPRSPTKDLSRYMFKSHDEHGTSTTTGGMPFVQCYHGVQDGVVYPLKEGLLFFKPPLFLHRSRLHSIACGRGGGGSRYVDMNLTLDQEEKQLEFTNIHRDELQVLNDYIHSTLIPAMKKDVEKEDAGNEEEDVVDANVEEVSDDVVAPPTSNKPQRNRRKAAMEAIQMNRTQVNQHDSESDDEEDEHFLLGDEPEEDIDSEDDEDASVVEEEHADSEEEEDDDEEEFFEEELEEESATESEEDEGPSKKARHE